jgi:hypothetical protein
MESRATYLAIGCGLLLVVGAVAGEPDFSQTTLEELKVPIVVPDKDAKTGFIIGGKNDTALIKKLTEINGRKIAELEKEMRPGVSSTAGFLGKDESLLEVLATDNEFVVEKLGLTHQELAKHLHIVGAIAAKHAKTADNEGFTFRYHGRRYNVKYVAFRGVVHSPFHDGTKTNVEATVTNLSSGAKLPYSLLVPHMIERYGFYEGHGTRFRVDPRAVTMVFDFLVAKKP